MIERNLDIATDAQICIVLFVLFVHIWCPTCIVHICCTCICTYLLHLLCLYIFEAPTVLFVFAAPVFAHICSTTLTERLHWGRKTFGSLFRRALIPQHLPNCDLYLFCLIWNHKLQTKQIWCTPPICNFQFQKSLLDKSYLQGAECKILWIWPAKCEERDTLKKKWRWAFQTSKSQTQDKNTQVLLNSHPVCFFKILWNIEAPPPPLSPRISLRNSQVPPSGDGKINIWCASNNTSQIHHKRIK